MANTVAGTPTSFSLDVDRVPQKVPCAKAKEIQLRNTGMNTLWISLDNDVWFDVSAGTSWDSRCEAEVLWVRTKIGKTSMVVLVTT